MRTTRRLAATLTLLALLGACQPPEPQPPTATIASSPPTQDPTPSEPPSSTPSASLEDYTVPAVIDDAYIQNVLTALYNLESEAARSMVASGQVTEEAERIVRAINRVDLVEPLLASYRESAAEDFAGVLQPPGNQAVRVEELLAATPNCVFVHTTRDFSGVLEEPSPLSGPTFIQLLPKAVDQDPGQLNPTPWIVGGSVLRTDGSSPENACAGF